MSVLFLNLIAHAYNLSMITGQMHDTKVVWDGPTEHCHMTVLEILHRIFCIFIYTGVGCGTLDKR